jgi:hypothetical protein
VVGGPHPQVEAAAQFLSSGVSHKAGKFWRQVRRADSDIGAKCRVREPFSLNP